MTGESAKFVPADHPIYLDYQATTPLLPEAFAAMKPYFEDRFGNPHSAAHRYGWEAEAGVDLARSQIAAALGVSDDSIVFMSGATEANNLALKGVFAARRSKRPRIVTAVSEHSCILKTVQHLRAYGAEVTLLPVRANGLLDLDTLDAALDDDVALVSIMTVNNEIGVIQDIPAIAHLAHACGALMHSDGAQALGKMDMLPVAAAADLVSLSAHKTYGPKGVGALMVKDSAKRMLVPQMDGGGQEGGLRSGTQAPALVAGFGAAVTHCTADRVQEEGRVTALRDRFLDQLQAQLPDISINGDMTARWVGNLNIGFPVRDAGRLMADLPGLALSSGAACSTADATATSHVLASLGKTRQQADASLRIGFGRSTTLDDIDRAVAMIVDAVQKQRP